MNSAPVSGELADTDLQWGWPDSPIDRSQAVDDSTRAAPRQADVIGISEALGRYREGAMQMRALAINDADAMARELTRVTLQTLAANKDDSLRDFEFVLKKAGR